ncbi:hypothetical protein [Methylocella sp. CPCC 101449]|uniref:hypothetical protein n=1 Tax=Methylocella sp. CPCC 101449 TaxID=2987531 RepID=UPI00288DA2F8|nr:hypothetical protein [Methylocella sp. CPCC 101449]MDT2023334.1 hypothetical protein [Methylocella sp. CPCC 101449]
MAMGSVLVMNPGDTAPGQVASFENALRSAIAAAVEKAQSNGRCDVKAVDVSQEAIRGRQTEEMLQNKGYSQKNGLSQSKVVVSDAVNGAAGFDNDGGLDYVLDVTNLVTGKTVAWLEGNVKNSNLIETADKIAADLVDQLCKKKVYHYTVSAHDLVIDHMICDLTKPFSLSPKGKMSGQRYTFTPSGETGGAFSLGGSAGGVPWSGGGSYTQTVSDTGGTLTMNGTWKVSAPVGGFSRNASIPGRLEAVTSTQCAGD